MRVLHARARTMGPLGRTKKWLLGGFVFAAAACASAVPFGSGSVGTAESELIGGEGGIPYNTGAIEIGGGGCTAVMIGPNQVLTAAHCVTTSTSFGSNGVPNTLTTTILPKYAVGATLTFTNSAIANAASNIFQSTVLGTDLPNDWLNTCSAGCTFPFGPTFPPDLAIITLADQFPRNYGYPSLTTQTASPGDLVTETGYGCQYTANDASDPGPAVFKYAEGTLIDPSNPQAVSAPGFKITSANVPAFSRNYFVTRGVHAGGSGSICPGDSGGPLFLGPFTQYSMVVGINSSWWDGDNSGISSYNFYARVDSPAAQAFIQATQDKYPTGNTTVDRGQPVNNGVDPISSLFPAETVSLDTPNTPGCTGVILTLNSILTAAHCGANTSTIVHFYPSGAGAGNIPLRGFADGGGSLDTQVTAVDQRVTCKLTDLDFPNSCFIKGDAGNDFNADLAVLTLATAINPAFGFTPVVLAPRRYGWSGLSNPPETWEVATGGPRPLVEAGARMMWAPVTYDPSSDTDQPQGYFFVDSLYGEPADMGGPVFRAPYFTDDASVDAGFVTMALLGLVGDIGPCLPGEACTLNKNMVVSVAHPDNYDWLVAHGASPVAMTATFGAGN